MYTEIKSLFNDKLSSNLEDQQQEFVNRLYFTALERGQILYLLVIIINLPLFYVYDYLLLGSQHSGFVPIIYWRLFVITVAAFFLILYRHKKPKSFHHIRSFHRIYAIMGIAFGLVIGTGGTILISKYIVPDISYYCLTIIGMAVLFHLPNQINLILYSTSLLAVFLGLRWSNLSAETLNLQMVNVIAVVIIGYVMERFTYKQVIENFKNLKIIEREREISERLLTNILPQPIAQRLRNSEKMIADAFQEVSILFADIVGFTELSATMTPEQVVEMLNTLFSRFDFWVEVHGVEKIKTIGDAYMVASGLPEPENFHAHKLALLALNMQAEIQNFNQENGSNLNLRIGINSGYVVAGVIGTKKFVYDIWGDSVNIASRMESHGIPGKIQVTKTTYDILQGDFVFEQRGEITVKGIGKMTTYFLCGKCSN